MRIDHSSFENPYFLSFDVLDSNFSPSMIWIFFLILTFHLDSIFPILTLGICHQTWISDRNQSSVWNHGVAEKQRESEKMSFAIDHSSFESYSIVLILDSYSYIINLDPLFIIFSVLLKFRGWNFCKVGRM